MLNITQVLRLEKMFNYAFFYGQVFADVFVCNHFNILNYVVHILCGFVGFLQTDRNKLAMFLNKYVDIFSLFLISFFQSNGKYNLSARRSML